MPTISKKQKLTRAQRNEDVILILKSVIQFKARHGGSNPSPTIMKPLYDSIKPKLHQYFNYRTLYQKIQDTKAMYKKALVKGVGPTEHEREMFELAVRAWDQDGELRKKMDARKKEEECGNFARLKNGMNKYWEDNGFCKKDLEVGLEFMDKDKAWILGKKWKAFMRSNAKIKKARLELNEEIREFVYSQLGEGADESEGTDENEGADESEGTDENEGEDESEGTDENEGADEGESDM